jgi:hypothetical protein
MAYNDQIVFNSRFKKEVACAVYRVEPLILRLQFKRPKSVSFPATQNLTLEFFQRKKRGKTGSPNEPIRVISYGSPDNIVLTAMILDHWERNHE